MAGKVVSALRLGVVDGARERRRLRERREGHVGLAVVVGANLVHGVAHRKNWSEGVQVGRVGIGEEGLHAGAHRVPFQVRIEGRMLVVSPMLPERSYMMTRLAG